MKKWIKEEDVVDILGISPPELLVYHIADLDGTYMNDEDVEEVSFEHLKAAADKLGYELIEKKKNGVSACPKCGFDSPILLSDRIRITGDKYFYYKCPGCLLCNRKVGKTPEKALMYWNSMVGEMRCK